MLKFFAIIISISALFGYVNHKWLRLPTTIGVMLISVVLGIGLKCLELIQPAYVEPFRHFLTGFDFSTFVLDFVLCFLLFAGSLHVNLNHLKGARATVFSYATLGVIISTFFIGLATSLILGAFGYDLPVLYCFLFGILSKYKIPQKLKTEIIGESLFNDGVGVVVFTIIFSLITGGEQAFTASNMLKIFGTEVIGGLAIGLIVGYLGYSMMKRIDHYQTEILITLAVVTGGYSIAAHFHASGPLAMVVAGLLIGNKGKEHAMSDVTAEYIDKFWELIDEICNVILFVLMGLEIFLVSYDPITFLLALSSSWSRWRRALFRWFRRSLCLTVASPEKA